MSDNFHSIPVPDLYAHAEGHVAKKTNLSFKKLLILSILAGIFISFGGAFATLIATGGGAMPLGIVKILMGIAFSLGLVLVLVGGAELFTGSTILSIGLFNKSISWVTFLKNLTTVYLGNFIGSIFIALLFFFSREYTFGNGAFGQMMFSVANSKMHHTFSEAVILGILCNMLVCLAIWLSYSARNTTDKVLAILFPVTAFIAMGFEHSVANMYLVPVALFIKKFDVGFLLQYNIESESLLWSNFICHNLIPVTIGNLIGGAIIWWFVWAIYNKKDQ